MEKQQAATPSQKKKKGFKGFFSFLSKKDKEKKELSTQAVKLSSNFAENVLDLELKIDSGNFDI